MTKISDLTALTGAGVDSTSDLLPIVDMSAAGAARNKKITIDEARISLGLGTAASPQFTGINLGHASDTTITRASAGVVAIEGVNIVTTAGGVTFAADIIVPDEAYDATAWNGSLEVPTKNAVRDKIESLSGGVTTLDGLTDVNAPTPSNGDVLTWDSTPGEWVAAAPAGGSSTIVFGIEIDGGGSTITTGAKGFVRIPAAHTITKVTTLSTDAAVTSCSITVDVWRDTYANFPPTSGDKISASAPATLSSATKSEDSTLTGWSTSGSAGDVYGFSVASVTGAKKILIEIEATV